MIFFKQGRT